MYSIFMNESEIPKREFTPNLPMSENIRFIKNEEGKRIAQQLTDSDVEKMKEKKEIDIIIV